VKGRNRREKKRGVKREKIRGEEGRTRVKEGRGKEWKRIHEIVVFFSVKTCFVDNACYFF
jgi:hypothetical protein